MARANTRFALVGDDDPPNDASQPNAEIRCWPETRLEGDGPGGGEYKIRPYDRLSDVVSPIIIFGAVHSTLTNRSARCNRRHGNYAGVMAYTTSPTWTLCLPSVTTA